MKVDRKALRSEIGSQAKGPTQLIDFAGIELEIIKERHVDYAGPLAGHQAGLMEFGGKRILVTQGFELPVMRRGPWPTIRDVIDHMLGPKQSLYLHLWHKQMYESLATGHFRPGQAVVFVGVPDCGKSVVQNYITTPLFGGRLARPYAYMSGKTAFNVELFQCEHSVIEDENASRDLRSRREFGQQIKQYTATDSNYCHGKNRTPLNLPVCRRLSISLNDDPEHLLILPVIDASLKPKIMLFHCALHPMPMPTKTLEQRQAFARVLRSEVEAYAYWLVKELKTPPELEDNRYGIKAYQSPKVIKALGDLSPESEFWGLLEIWIKNNAKIDPTAWMRTPELMVKVTEDPGRDYKMREFLHGKSTGQVGGFLAKLRKQYPKRIKCRISRGNNEWQLYPDP